MTIEQTAYVIMGLLGYGIAYLTVGCGATSIWKLWALRKAGEFWEYSLDQGIKRYYPGVWYFARYHNWIYSVLLVSLWPVAIPLQMVVMTRALKRTVDTVGYYY